MKKTYLKPNTKTKNKQKHPHLDEFTNKMLRHRIWWIYNTKRIKHRNKI